MATTSTPRDRWSGRRGVRRVVRLVDGPVGWLGLHEHVEPVLRRALCGHFGLAWEGVSEELHLADDLGATALDLAELAVAIDRALGVTLPTPVLSRLATVGDLVDATVRALAGERAPSPEDPIVRIRFTRSGSGGAPFVERVGRTTPYFAEAVADDVRRLGPDGRIDVFVASETSWTALERVCARLNARGARVAVHRSAGPVLRSA